MDGFFYCHDARSPHENMGFDEYLMRRALAGDRSLCARLYRWDTGCITIGRNQEQERALVWDQLGDTPVIRRVTGGRALFHDPTELTYSFLVPPGALGGFQGSHVSVVRSISEKIAEILNLFLNDLGLSATYARQSEPIFKGRTNLRHPCFASVARYELVYDGRKVVASAAFMAEGVFFQHGSIKLRGVAEHPALPLGIPVNSTDKPDRVNREDLPTCAEYFVQRVSEELRMSFRTQPWSPSESDQLLDESIRMVRQSPLASRIALNKQGNRGVLSV